MNTIQTANTTSKTRSFICVVFIYWHLFWRKIRSLADCGSGYDQRILQSHGSDLDRTKARAVGYTNLAASSLGAVGAFTKAFLIIPGLMAFPAAIALAGLYATITYNLERTLAAGLSPLMTGRGKAAAFFSRLLISCITASFQAAPWVALALHGQVETKLAQISLIERQDARAKLTEIHGVAGVAAKGQALDKALRDVTADLTSMPETVIDARQLADRCSRELDTLLAQNRVRATSLNAKLPALATVLMSSSATEIQKEDAKLKRANIDLQLRKLADGYLAQKAACTRMETQAVDAKNRYMTETTARKDKTAAELEAQKKTAAEVAEQVGKDVAAADNLTAKANVANSTAEAKAMIALVRDEVYAKFLAIAIFMFFLTIDLSPIGLKLLALKPGPYDFAMQHRAEIDQIVRAAEKRQAVEDEDIAQATSTARRNGVLTFHKEDAGAVFAREERLNREEHLLAREQTQDLKVAKAQLLEIEALVVAIEASRERVKSNPQLLARLNEVLSVLNTPAPAGAPA